MTKERLIAASVVVLLIGAILKNVEYLINTSFCRYLIPELNFAIKKIRRHSHSGLCASLAQTLSWVGLI